jgi:hypothetical protein
MSTPIDALIKVVLMKIAWTQSFPEILLCLDIVTLMSCSPDDRVASCVFLLIYPCPRFQRQLTFQQGTAS